MPSSSRKLYVGGIGALAFLVACASMRPTGGGALEPRFVAVHNTLSSMGLAQVGPIHEGSIGEGKEEHATLALPAGCLTIVVMAGGGLRDIEANLLDGRGASVAHDASGQPQAVLRPCLEAADSYVLVLKSLSGTGTWVAEAWAGGAAGSTVASAPGAHQPQGDGTCESPLALSPGVVSGSTARGESNSAGSCGPSDSNEIVYALTVTTRMRAIFDVEADFDSVLYVRKDDCSDPKAEIECNDDSSDRKHSHVEAVLEPGKYFVFVDGYGREVGNFKLTVSTTDAQALIDRCRRAQPLAEGVSVSATLGANSDTEATCGGGAQGPEAVWRTELPVRARVRVVEHSDDVVPVVHLRRACIDAQSEVACSDSGSGPGDASVDGIFEAGTYYAFADAHDSEAAGHASLLLQTAPPGGSSSRGDVCGDAVPLPVGPGGSIEGDTFDARDDMSGSCGGVGAADVVYRFEVAKRSLFVASLDAEEAKHLLVIDARCGDRGTEIACGRSVREVLLPGTYFLEVDGTSPDAFGRFTLKWTVRDVTTQAAACAAAPLLVPGRAATGTTAGAGDRFGTPCGTSDSGANGPDRVFKLVLARRGAVRLSLTAAFDSVVALRKACSEPSDGPAPDLACESETDGNHHTTLTRTLEGGTYWVVVDGQSSNDQGPFTLDYRVEPSGG